MRVATKQKPKVMIGLSEVAGYNNGLKRGFEELGIECAFIELYNHKFQYGANKSRNIYIRFVQFLGDKRISTPQDKFLKRVFWILCQQISISPLFLWALLKYDVFIFGFGESFFRSYDLPILKLLRKKLIFIFYGSDSRPPYLNKKFLNSSTQECIRASYLKKRQIQKINKYADILIDNPLSSHFHEREIIAGMRMGIPFAMQHRISEPKLQKRDNIRILHAPSDPAGKGTEIIRQSIKNLVRKGYQIEFIEIAGKPNREVLEALSTCDFVVDEIYSDALMAMFATEAAYFGKAAVVCGYATLQDFGDLPQECIPPVHHSHPDMIQEAIELLTVNKKYRIELGERAKKFVQEYWTARTVAERYLKLINGEHTREWFYNPQNVQYLYGWGFSEQKLKEHLKRFIDCGGKKALQLSDKPDLEQRFIDFAQSGLR